MNGYTIAVHKGTKRSGDHNRRNPKIVDKEKHIRKDGDFENLIDIKINDVYERLFADAVQKYNAKQKRKDRRIDSYLADVKKNEKLHVCYENIVGVYDYKIDAEKRVLSDDEKKEILKRYLDDFIKENPNLFVFGAYLHNDEYRVEDGKEIATGVHMHIDYVPFADFEKGLERRNTLAGALKAQGYDMNRNVESKWLEGERKRLTDVVQSYGVQVVRGVSDGRAHEETPIYKRLKDYEKKLSRLLDVIKEYGNGVYDIVNRVSVKDKNIVKDYKISAFDDLRKQYKDGDLVVVEKESYKRLMHAALHSTDVSKMVREAERLHKMIQKEVQVAGSDYLMLSAENTRLKDDIEKIEKDYQIQISRLADELIRNGYDIRDVEEIRERGCMRDFGDSRSFNYTINEDYERTY